MPSVALLAQLPPPVHGVTVTTERVFRALSTEPETRVDHLWGGSSDDLARIDGRNLAKLAGFAALNARLAGRGITGPRYDIAYTTLAPWSHAALRDGIVAWWGQRIARRTLVHVHGEGLDGVVGGTGRQANALRHMLRGTELIAITEDAARIARDAGLFAAVHRLPNAAPDPGTPASRPAAGRERPLRIGFFGNLDPRKGVLRFIAALEHLVGAGCPVEGAIAGGATRHLTPDGLRATLAERGLGDRVQVLGQVLGPEKSAFLAGLDVLLYPSLHDHAPLVVIEAMAHGVVPIVMATGGVPELLGPELQCHVLGADLADDARDRAIATLVAQALDDEAGLARRRALVRQRYLDEYTEARFTERLRALMAGPAHALVAQMPRVGAVKTPCRAQPPTPPAGVRAPLPSALKAHAFGTIRAMHAWTAPRRLPERIAVYFHALDPEDRRGLVDCVTTLAERGYRFVDLDTYTDRSISGQLANLSFDDNYRSWHAALGLLSELDVHATFYVNSLPFRDTCPTAEIEAYFDRLSYCGARVPLSRTELREIADRGHEIACHSHSHHVLARLARSAWEGEIARSKAILEDIVGREVRHFSWPYGMPRHISEPIKDYCLNLGFQSLSGAMPGLLHDGPWNRRDVPRTAWRCDRSIAANLTDLAIDGRPFARWTGRSPIG